MSAWFRRVELFPWAITEVPLSEGEAISIGNLEADDVISRPAPRDTIGATAEVVHLGIGRWFVHSKGGEWHLSAFRAEYPATVNGATTTFRVLSHGDTLQLRSCLLIFETRRAPAEQPVVQSPAELFAPGSRRAWADWLAERGDPRSEELALGRGGESTLEGLSRDGWAQSIEWDWLEGLSSRVTVRSTATSGPSLHRLGRLLSLPSSQWITELTIDLVPLRGEPSQARLDAPLLVRLLLEAAVLPHLTHLSLGYLAFQPELSHSLEALVARLPLRYPGLTTRRVEILQSANRAALELVSAPSGLDVGLAAGEQVPLDGGLWVGSSAKGSLRALGPGTRRTGMAESFLVLDEVTAWTLVPLTQALKLNGRPACTTRLLPGDVVDDPSGARFRFRTT